MKKTIFMICFAMVLTLNICALEKKSGAEVKVLTKTVNSWDGEDLPAYPKGTPEITILDITIPAGVVLDWHRHPVINAGILLEGELTVTTDKGHILHLKAGDPIVEVVDTWHYGKNEGSKPARIVVFYAGIKNKPVTIKK